MDRDTITALATPPGKGGIAVIRISGNKTLDIIRLAVQQLPEKIIPNRVYHSFILKNRKRIDECLVVYFKKPYSYTGEDLAEISIHANPFLVEEVLDLIIKKKARSALPGEFTYRAFKNGKLDLIQAEAVNELVSANSKYYALMKFSSLEGKLSELLKKLKKNLIELLVKTETMIEFEEDQYITDVELNNELKSSTGIVDKLLSSSRFNEVLNNGFKVVIVGKVNVGKSSLFNSLLMKERAITSCIPGTTRDFIEEKIYLDGIPFQITDVAGIRQKSKNDIEIKGIRRSMEKINESEAVIFMLDVSQDIDEDDLEIFQNIKLKRKIVVANKIDIVNEVYLKKIKKFFKNENVVKISVKDNLNIEAIYSFLESLYKDLGGKDFSFIMNQRQKSLLEQLKKTIEDIKKIWLADKRNIEIIAEETRKAIDIIGRLTGEISTQDILNVIFSQFCIGK